MVGVGEVPVHLFLQQINYEKGKRKGEMGCLPASQVPLLAFEKRERLQFRQSFDSGNLLKF